MPFRACLAALLMASLAVSFAVHAEDAPAGPDIERVSTVVPFPRGLAVVDDQLYVLARGRVRGSGGVSAEVNDRAGTLYVVDPNMTEPITEPLGDRARNNGKLVAEPTSPPFHLWDRAANPSENDRLTDRPYCTLRYHEPTRSLYLCAFSGIDKPRKPGASTFSKNLTDAVLRYDLRTAKWYEVERHNIEAGGNYPHHDPAHRPAPHGWLNGPDNCLAVGNWLYVVAKDNSRLVRYDLSKLVDDPEAGHPDSTVVLGEDLNTENAGPLRLQGHSMLAAKDGWLYLGTRTSSHIVRLRLADDGSLAQPMRAQLVGRFAPYDPTTGKTPDLTDMDMDDKGRLYIVSAQPSRVFRFTPDPQRIYDATDAAAQPWADLAAATDNPRMKSENVLVHDGWAYVTSGDGYGYQKGADGTIYRVRIDD
jgi:hypothetical protein